MSTMSEPDLTKKMKGGNTNTNRQQAVPPKASTSRPDSDSTFHDDPPEEDISDEHDQHYNKKKPKTNWQKKGDNREPAYVSPIPKIGSIPSIGGSRPQLPRYLTSSIVGMKISETGDVVDDQGKVHGRVAGDLPSMVGRTVMNQRGDVLGDDGELLGYVAELEADKKGAAESSNASQSLKDYLEGRKSAFQINHLGQILDDKGEIVGSFHDYKKMGPKPDGRQSSTDKAPGEEETEEETEEEGAEASGSGAKEQQQKEEKQNAQSWRKEDKGESPSDIFLDVKSTREGIQLTIRIPTVFGARDPKITFS